jgi:hypothetical protein
MSYYALNCGGFQQSPHPARGLPAEFSQLRGFLRVLWREPVTPDVFSRPRPRPHCQNPAWGIAKFPGHNSRLDITRSAQENFPHPHRTVLIYLWQIQVPGSLVRLWIVKQQGCWHCNNSMHGWLSVRYPKQMMVDNWPKLGACIPRVRVF